MEKHTQIKYKQVNTDISERIGRCYSICKESTIAVKFRVVHKLFQTKVGNEKKGGNG